MMEPISIEEFVKLHVKSNPGEKPEDVRVKLRDAVRRKQAGVVCMICGQPIWAIGSAIAEWNGCFTCITGETDHSDDYEIDEVCSY